MPISQIIGCTGRAEGLGNHITQSIYSFKCSYLKKGKGSSEIENIITTHDKLYQAFSAKGVEPDPATKEVLCYREAALFGFNFIKQKRFLSKNAIIEIQKILEENNAGIRKLPGMALRNATPSDKYDSSSVKDIIKN